METSLIVKSEKASLYELASASKPKKEKVALEKGAIYQIFRSSVIFVDKSGLVAVRDIRKGTEKSFKVHDNAVLELTLKYGRLATVCDKTLKVWNLKAEKPFKKPISKSINIEGSYQRVFDGAVIFHNYKCTDNPEIVLYVSNVVTPFDYNYHAKGLEISEQIRFTHIYITRFTTSDAFIFDSNTNHYTFFKFSAFQDLFDGWGLCNDQLVTIKKEVHSSGANWKLAGYNIYVDARNCDNSLFHDFFDHDKARSHVYRPTPNWQKVIDGPTDLKFEFSKRSFSYTHTSTTFIVFPSENKVERVVQIKNATHLVYGSYVFIARKGSLSLVKDDVYDGKKSNSKSLVKITDFKGDIKIVKVTDGILYFEDDTGLNSIDFKKE